MDLNAWQRNWDELGKDDPLWVVLTDASKTGRRWNPEDFFATGREEIRAVLSEIDGFNVAISRQRALDFGCGVGRLSQALSEYFEEVHGVDIAPSMVSHANRFNRFPGKCTYHINAENGLSMFPRDHFDFVYSNLTLQHIELRFAENYIREFIRVIKPGGVVAFQVLTPVLWRSCIPPFAVRAWRRLKHGRTPFIGMFGMSQKEVASVLENAGAKLIHVEALSSDSPRFLSYRYYLTKASPRR